MAIGKISEELKSATDYIFNGTTVTANTTTTSDEHLVGGTQGELEIVVVVGDTAIALADTKVLSIKLTGASESGGTYADVVTIYSVTASGATTLAVGTELARYIVKPSDPLYGKVVVTNNDTALTGKVTSYIRRVCR